MATFPNKSINDTGAGQMSNLTNTHIAACIVNTVFSLTAVIGNGLVLRAIWKTPALHTPSNLLLVGLALSDFGVGFIVQPFYVFCLILEIVTKKYFTAIWTAYRTSQAIFVSATVLTLTAVSLDRFLALYLHLRYTVFVTVKRSLMVLFLIWTLSAIYAFTLIIDIELHRGLSIFFVLSSLLVNSIIYCVIFRIARHHRKQIQNYAQMNVNNVSSRKRHRKSAFNMFVIFLLLCFCYIPYLYVRIRVRFSQWPLSTIRLTISWSAVLVYINSSLNPLVYCWRMRDLRTAMKTFVRTSFVESGRGK